MLQRMPEVGGLVMVNFFTCYLSDDCRERDVTVLDVVKHINHIRWRQNNKLLQQNALFSKQNLFVYVFQKFSIRELKILRD